MNSFLAIVIIILGSAALSLYLPWYSIAAVALLVGSRASKSYSESIIIGFLGCALTWLLAAFFIDYKNESILSSRMLVLLQLKSKSYLFSMVALIAGLVGALASLTGYSFRRIFAKKAPNRNNIFPGIRQSK
jgi:hypothetical protein